MGFRVYKKREFVITTNEQYPQDVKLECIKDKTSLLDGLSEGDDVEVSFNVRGMNTTASIMSIYKLGD